MDYTEDDYRKIFDNIPPTRLVFDQDIIAKYCLDQRERYLGNSPLLLRPESTEEVSLILQRANEHKVTITIQGGNTSLCGAATPFGSVILSMEKMNRFLDFHEQDLCMAVEAGMILSDVQAEAEKRGYYFPLRIASEHSCQIGGNIACNAGGLNVLRYGVTRDLVMGLEVVLPSGKIINHMAPLHKNTTGYNVIDLFNGSEGTLGVITKALVKVSPRIIRHFTFWIDLDNFDDALRLLVLMKKHYATALQSFELISKRAREISCAYQEPSFKLNQDAPWSILCELAESEDIEDSVDLEKVASLLAENDFHHVSYAESESQRKTLWQLRENLAAAEKKIGYNIHHDIALPIEKIGEFYLDSLKAFEENFDDADICLFGHLGDGSLHYNVFLTNTLDLSVYEQEPKMNKVLYDVLMKYKGTVAAEHGIGILKREHLYDMKDLEELRAMKVIKNTFDPNGIMNPGKVLPDDL